MAAVGLIALDLPGLADDLTLIVATSGGTTEVTAAQIQAGFTITDAADLAADIKLIDQGGSDGYQEVGLQLHVRPVGHHRRDAHAAARCDQP